MVTSGPGSGATDEGDRRSLLELARLQIVQLRLEDFDDLKRAMVSACRVSALTLGVERVGIWSLSEDQGALRRAVLYDQRTAETQIDRDWTLPLSAWPAYRAAIRSRRVVAADDAPNDPRTCELARDYLAPNGVSSMLDAPLFVRGDVWGVVCHEHTGVARVWSAREIDFAVSVADMLSAMLEQAMRVALEERLRESEAELARVREAEAVVKTAAAIGHDINTLLQAISGRAEMASRRQQPGEAADMLADIMADCQRAARVVQQLRELDQPTLSIGVEADLSFVIDDLRPTLTALLGSSHQLETDLCEQARVTARRGDIERVVINLVVNAKEAMPDGGLVVLRVLGSQARVLLEVSDAGKGIAPDQAARVFEPYFTTKDGRNSGLGLFAVQTIARRTGGVASIESSDSGTTVRVSWPAAAGPS